MLDRIEDRRRRGAAAAAGRGPDQALSRFAAACSARARPCARSMMSRSPSPRARRVGIVGESGCGKSTTARLLMHLMDTRRRRHPLRRHAGRPRAVAARSAARHADGVSGQLCLAQSAPDDRGIDRVRPEGARHGRQRGAHARPRTARQGRPAAGNVSPTATRTKSPAASASASTSRVRWRCRRGW